MDKNNNTNINNEKSNLTEEELQTKREVELIRSFTVEDMF